MPKLVVKSFAVSLDGYGAGPDQDAVHPLGRGGPDLMDWFFQTRTFQAMQGTEGGETGTDDRLAADGFKGVGAWILGRNMFGPVRGAWPDESWRGWWGENPPFHTPVFVLTHFARPPLKMAGGTEFHFVTGGPEEALVGARAAAGGKDVRLGGGGSRRSASTLWRVASTSCTWRCDPSCSAVASTFWRGSISRSLVTNAAGARQASGSPTCFCASA
jgi:dihydrofolate reductase